MQEIKPCPFCGASGEALQVDSAADGLNEWAVWCSECGARGGWIDGYGKRFKDIEPLAIELWNERAERTCKLVAPKCEPDNKYMCGSCGHDLTFSRVTFHDCYCPRCGSKVVE